MNRESKVFRTAVTRAETDETHVTRAAGGAGQKACANCGARFACGSIEGRCWCDEVKLSLEALASLRARFADCLCFGCLAAAEDAKLNA